ncbi:MAG: hypothetical protein GY940_18695 [bacterium]|nr:hypothetical protein [bacterium]
MKRFKRFILITMMILLSVTFLTADIFIKTNQHTDAYEAKGQTQPAKDEVSTQWIGKDKYASITPAKTIIVDIAAKKFYILYHGPKAYVETTLPLDILTILPDNMKAKLPMLKMAARVTPTGQTRKIGAWNCNAYKIEIRMQAGKIEMNTWTTQEVPFDTKTLFKDFLMTVTKEAMPGLDDNSLAQFAKITGIQVYSANVMNMMGTTIKSTAQVTEITEKDPPPGVYGVPQGYARQEKMK